MKIIINPNTIVNHLDEIDRKTDEAYAARKIHYFFIPLLSAVTAFLICSITGKILVPILAALAFVIIFPQILFLILPSCHYPLVPTPKMFCCEAARDGEVLEIDVETKLIGGILSILIEKENGEQELRRLRIKTKKDKSLNEDVMDFEQGIFFISGKETEDTEVTIVTGEEEENETKN